MIFTDKPKGFITRFSVSSCFCEHNGKFILLRRHGNKSQGLKWGVPAGKIEENETPEQAVLREIFEETGIKADNSRMKYFGRVFVRYSDYDFVYHIFHYAMPEKTSIKINSSEHTESLWASSNEALDLQLVQDLDACIRLFYSLP